MHPKLTRAYTPAGAAAAAAGTFTWGVGIVLIKLTDSPFLIASFWRHAFSVPILLVAWALSSDRSLPWRTAGVGGILFAAHQVAHFSSLKYSTAAIVTIFFSLQPILVGSLGGRVTGERTTRRFYAWSVVAIAGCAIVVLASTGGAGTTPLGTTLAVVNLVAWSAYYLATKRARENVTTVSWLVVMTVVSGCCIGVIAILAGNSFVVQSSREWILLACVAIIPGTIGHLLVTWAHPRIHAAASSAITLGVPVVAAVGAAIFLDEPFGPMHVVGALLALGATAVAMRHLPPPVTEEAVERYGEVAT
ncbi:MAG: DMT family transporter [Actinomycetota bacterium]